MNVGRNVQLLCNATTTGAKPEVRFQLGLEVLGSFQAELTGGTVTAVIEGRMSPEAPWVTLTTAPTSITATGIGTITRVMPEMRVNISAITGTLRLWVMA